MALAEAACPGRASRSRRIEMEAAIRPDAWLFGESQSRILVSRKKYVGRLRELARDADAPCAVLGEVRGRRLRIGTLIDVSTAGPRHVWADALAERMGMSEAGMGGRSPTRALMGVYGHRSGEPIRPLRSSTAARRLGIVSSDGKVLFCIAASAVADVFDEEVERA